MTLSTLRVENVLLLASAMAQRSLGQVDNLDTGCDWADSDMVAGRLRGHTAMVIASLQALVAEFSLHELVAIKAECAEECLVERL